MKRREDSPAKAPWLQGGAGARAPSPASGSRLALGVISGSLRFMPRCRFRSVFVLAVLLATLVSTARLSAQSVLCVEHEQKIYAVRKVRESRAYIEVDGKLVPAHGRRCALKKAEEYLPFFISVAGKELVSSRSGDFESGREYNHQLHFRGTFTSPYLLEDVFLVLEMETQNAGKELFFYEVGRLEPNTPQPLSVTTTLGDSMGHIRYTLHLFSGGSEVLHSDQSPQFRDAVLDRIVARQIATVRQAAPKFFLGPEAEYPAALRKSGIKGSVTLALRIDPRGAVLDPVVQNASDPAFGEAALAAVRQWRFLPRIENGRPQEARTTLPIDFEPPAPAAGKG